MPSESVLIVGAGVAGSVLAFWLAKYDFKVVVIERSKASQKAGQGIEIEEPALQVVKSMGILDTLRERSTGEKGAKLLDEQSRCYGTLDVGSASPTGELELMRGDLTEVLYEAANRSINVEYRFETVIQSLKQTQDKVTVQMEDRKTKAIMTETFDFVMGADGARSRTRQLIMGFPEDPDNFKHVGAFVSYFSIPREDQDWPYSRLWHFPNRRVLWIRPVAKDADITSVYLIHLNDNIPSLQEANALRDRVKQKEAFAEIFDGVGGEASRVIQQMMKAENFYSDELVQVKLPKWSQNRVTLLGDSAWAPTPFTGQGNQLAIIGAWVLAQEMSRNRTVTGFENYEKRLRPYVEQCQNIPLNGYAPYMCCPQTQYGIWTFRMVFFFLAWITRFMTWTKLASLLPEGQSDDFDLEMDGIKVKKS